MQWVELVATLALLVVTTWYAATTKSLANTARKAAADSDRATAAAERSAGATRVLAETAREAATDSAKATAAAERSAEAAKALAETARETAADSARATAAAERSAEAALDAARVAQSQIKASFAGRQVFMSPSDPSDVPELGDYSRHEVCLIIESTGDAVVVQQVRIVRALRVSYDETGRTLLDVQMTAAGPSKLPRRLHHGEKLYVTHPEIQEVHDDPFERYVLEIDYTFTEDGSVGATKELVFDVDLSR